MRVLVVGSGGREDALAWRLARDPTVRAVATTPGNPGTARWGENIAGPPEEAARRFRPDLVVVGPEAPLAEGLADRLRAAGFAVFGPGASGARLETSKAFAKEVMRRAGIPTARAAVATTPDEARRAIETIGGGRGVVVKADGLAAGKGVVVAESAAEAVEAAEAILAGRFGAAGARLVIEERLSGAEASVLAIVDGRRFLLLPAAEDHKRLLDGDRGPNTGGMGAISPTPVVTDEIRGRVEDEILEPLLADLRAERIAYRGMVYVGLMVEGGRPRVLEWNVRFGDPEAQAVLPRVRGDLAGALLSAAEGRLETAALGEDEGAAACVVAAAAGYPDSPETGAPIEGPVLSSRGDEGGPIAFVAGARAEGGRLVVAGGRVVGAVGRGADLEAAIAGAYDLVGRIRFEGMQYRRDIGRRRTPAGAGA